jgi:putative Ca2+/H+ antiporter (TMEM165/GDT1 family)
LIGALAGGSLAQVVPAELLQLVAAAGFLLIGGRLLWAATVNQGTTPS